MPTNPKLPLLEGLISPPERQPFSRRDQPPRFIPLQRCSSVSPPKHV
jgi:hypothetical protein